MISRYKIIQIAVAPGDDHSYRCLFALCEDGTLWKKTMYQEGKESDWELIETRSMNQ